MVSMIEVKHLRKEYDNTVALGNLQLEIAQGEVFGLIGPNGAGKTTLIRVLATLLEPTYGEVRIAGIDEMRKEPEENWEIAKGTSPNYFLFPNIQINVTPFGFLLFRTYPKPGDPSHSFSRIGFYARPDPLEEFGELIEHNAHRPV